MSLNLKSVSIEELHPNPWNPNTMSPEMELKVEESIKRFGGLFKPIVVRELGSHYEILGGEHRWRAARKLGYREVPIASVGAVSDQMAKEIALADNGRYGDDDPLKLAQLLKDLPGVDELKSFLPITDDELGAIFAAQTVALDELEGLDAGATEAPTEPAARPSPTHQIMRFKVPVEDVAWVTGLIDRRMKEQGFNHQDSLENAGDAFVHIMKQVKDL